MTRARELCRQTGDNKSQFIAEWNLWHVHVCRAEHWRAQDLGEQLMATAERESDPDLPACRPSTSSGSRSAPRPATARLWPAASGAGRLYDPERHGSHHLTYGAHDPGVCSRIECAHAMWCLGRPERARACSRARVWRSRAGWATRWSCCTALAKGLPLLQLLPRRRSPERPGRDHLPLAAEQDFRQLPPRGPVHARLGC